MITDENLRQATNELSRIVHKGLYGSESKREIMSFLHLFPTLENILSNTQLTIKENIEEHNENLRQINNELPKLTSTIWEIYRRNLFTSTFIIDTKKTKNLTKPNLDLYLSKQYLEQSESLKELKYKEWISETCKNGTYFNEYGPEESMTYYSIKEESPQKLINIENLAIISGKKTILPINIYTFKNRFTEEITISHLDLSSSEIPYLKKFIKGNMSFKTRSYFNDLQNKKHLTKQRLDNYYRQINSNITNDENYL